MIIKMDDKLLLKKNTIHKLLFVAPTVTGGGAERVVSVLTTSLAELGYQVDLILYERRDNEYPLSDKVKVHLLPKKKHNQFKVSYIVGRFLVLRKLIREIAPDVLIPFLPYQVEHCFLASRGLRVPFVVTVRNNPLFDTPNEKMRRHRDKIVKYADAVFLQTESQKAYFKTDIQKKCFVISNPIGQEILDTQYEYKKSVKKIVTMGRLEKQKNHALLIKAFNKIHELYPDVKLDIYGTGSLHDALQQMIERLELHDAVSLCGRTNNVRETLANYDLFILTSDFEGMPNALMEAMGLGMPCISTDCPTGPGELIGQEERGLLVQVNDELALIEKIRCAIDDPASMRNKGAEARRYIEEKFAPDVISNMLVCEMEKYLEEAK